MAKKYDIEVLAHPEGEDEVIRFLDDRETEEDVCAALAKLWEVESKGMSRVGTIEHEIPDIGLSVFGFPVGKVAIIYSAEENAGAVTVYLLGCCRSVSAQVAVKDLETGEKRLRELR